MSASGLHDGDPAGLFAVIIEAIEVGVNVWRLEDPDDPAGIRLVYANQASVAATGLAVEAAVGRTMRDAFPDIAGSDRPGIYAEVALGAPARVLGDIVHRIGEVEVERTFSVRIVGLPDRQVGVVFTDVTNAAGERLFGHPREALLGSRWLDVFPEADGSPLWAARQQAVREQVTVAAEAYFAPPDTWLSARFYPTPDGVAGYVQDVTERKLLEAQLLQSQKLDAVGQLASGVAHDFNNVLTVIEGYSALGQAKLDADPQFVGSALKEIRNATGSAAALTAKLLAFSRREPARTASADLNTIVAAALALVAPLIGEDVIVHRALSPEPMTVDVDVAQIEQVIVNLAVKARDAMPDGGELWVTTAPVAVDLDPSTGRGPQFCAQLIVTDTGCGIDERTLAQIFDAFLTTKPAGKGTGLGLSTAMATIKQAAGRLDVTSTPGHGTTFTISLPRTDSCAAMIPGDQPATSLGAPRILLVDDNDSLRHLFARTLRTDGYDITEARDADQAAQLLIDRPFDLLITDHVMPGSDRQPPARIAALQHPRMPILHISGYPQTPDSTPQTSAPTAFLLKPFSADQLAQLVSDLLAKGLTSC